VWTLEGIHTFIIFWSYNIEEYMPRRLSAIHCDSGRIQIRIVEISIYSKLKRRDYMFKRIDTVFLPVKNIAAAIEWYRDRCGFNLRWHHEEGGYAAMDIGDGETAFTLVRQEQMGNQKPETHEWFNLYTANAHAAYDQLVAAGVEVTDIMKDESAQFFTFKDLDGNVIGVCSFEE